MSRLAPSISRPPARPLTRTFARGLAPALLVLVAPLLPGADIGPSAPSGQDATAAPHSFFDSGMMLPVFAVAMIAFMLLSSRSQAKAEEAKKKALFESLKPGQKVVTTFGMIAEIERMGSQSDTVWLLQGEGKNAIAVEYQRSAIASKYEPAPAAPAPGKPA
jgi:preprotein translocase YajC subunit